MRKGFRPKLRTILLLANLCILLLPLGGIAFFKIYESELIRQTESALIGQAALLRAAFSQELAEVANRHQADIPAAVTLPVDSPFYSQARFTPINPLLDMAKSRILPSGGEATLAVSPADGISREAGKNLNSLLRQSQRITLCGIRLVDYQGVVVASSGSELGLSLAHRVEVRRALDGYYASVLRRRFSDEPPPGLTSQSRKGWVRVLVAMPVLHQGRVVGAVLLSRSPLEVSKGLFVVREHLLLAGGAIMILVVLVTLLTDRLISRPLKRLVSETQRVERQGGVMPLLPHAGSHEVAELCRAISLMTERLQKRSDYIRDFARHVSHEFKTPLTGLRGAVELLQDVGEEMTRQERQRFLANMDGDIERLDQLTRGLLELARADMASNQQACCDPIRIIRQCAQQASLKGQEVCQTVDGQVGEVAVDAEILRDVVANMVQNSFLHGLATRVELSLATMQTLQGLQVVLFVIDDGRGIDAGHRDKIFSPFFTTARNRGGTGLGLTLCRSFIEGSGGTLSLESGEQGACTFCLLLPRCSEGSTERRASRDC